MKKKVAIIFGGCSSEYNVSLVSATSVIRNINKNKYYVIMIGITPEGDFYLYDDEIDKIDKNEWLNSSSCKKITISTNRSDHGIIVLETNEIITSILHTNLFLQVEYYRLYLIYLQNMKL